MSKGKGERGGGGGAGGCGGKCEAAPEGAVAGEVVEEVAGQGEVVCMDGSVFRIAVGGGQGDVV